MTTDDRRNERGVITAMFAVLAVFFVLIISLVAEGGRKLSNLSQAEDIAAEAARAAAATLDLDQIASGVGAIDQVDGRAQAQAEAIVSYVPGAVLERFVITGDSVFVSVRVSADSYLPGLDIDGVGSHRAQVFDPFG
ncbi:hypothetical protein N9R50_00850 [bacterium]|nr:hypothetical protein [bacterium]